jgi:hypothetical protein
MRGAPFVAGEQARSSAPTGAMLRSQAHARTLRQPQPAALGLLLRDLQPLAPPNALNPCRSQANRQLAATPRFCGSHTGGRRPDCRRKPNPKFAFALVASRLKAASCLLGPGCLGSRITCEDTCLRTHLFAFRGFEREDVIVRPPATACPGSPAKPNVRIDLQSATDVIQGRE